MPVASRQKPKYHVKRHEENDQLKFATWLKREFPHVIFFTDYAAGLNLTDNQRIKMMRMRSDDGIPDTIILFPSRGFHGLIIEHKKEGTTVYKRDGTLRKQAYRRKYRRYGKLYIKSGDHLAEQAALLTRLNSLNYCSRFAIGLDKAKQLMNWYMQVPENAELF